MLKVQVSDESKKLIRALTQGAASGYSLMKRSGLNENQIATAVAELQSLLIIKGAQTPERIGDSYIVLSPDTRGDALGLL